MKQRVAYVMKWQLRPGEARSPVNYKVSETQVLGTMARLQVPRGYIMLRFYIGRDITIRLM